MNIKTARIRVYYFLLIVLLSLSFAGPCKAALGCWQLFDTDFSQPYDLLRNGSFKSIERALVQNPTMFTKLNVEADTNETLDSYPGVVGLLERAKNVRSLDAQKKILGILSRIAKINQQQDQMLEPAPVLTEQERATRFYQSIQDQRSSLWARANASAAAQGRFNPYRNRHNTPQQSNPVFWNTAEVQDILNAEPSVWLQMLKNPEAFKYYLP